MKPALHCTWDLALCPSQTMHEAKGAIRDMLG